MNQRPKDQISNHAMARALRKTFFKTRNQLIVEIFQARVRDGFELWVVGPQDRQRVILNHYLTHDDLETRLRYSKSILLTWTQAKESDLPAAKSLVALEEEKTIECGTVWDSTELFEHLVGVETLDCEPEDLETARHDLAGTWSDGASSLTFDADGTCHGSISTSSSHAFVRGLAALDPDAWQLSDHWQLRLKNRKSARAERRLVHSVSEGELHLAGEGNCVALVLKRKV